MLSESRESRWGFRDFSFKWRGKGRMWFWGSELGGRTDGNLGSGGAHRRKKQMSGPECPDKNSLPPLTIREQESREVETSKRWEELGWEKDPDRHPGISKSTPRELRQEGVRSLISSCPDPQGTENVLPAGVWSRTKAQKPHWLTFWGAHRMASFSYPTPAPMRSWNILYPLEKKCNRESGICVHDNRGNVIWQIWVHLYSNISVYDSGTFLHEIFQNHIE